MLSSHIRLGADGGAGPVADTAAALGELGLDLAIIILPPPHDPAVLTPLADALTQLRCHWNARSPSRPRRPGLVGDAHTYPPFCAVGWRVTALRGRAQI
jgi:hypothetical protein